MNLSSLEQNRILLLLVCARIQTVQRAFKWERSPPYRPVQQDRPRESENLQGGIVPTPTARNPTELVPHQSKPAEISQDPNKALIFKDLYDQQKKLDRLGPSPQHQISVQFGLNRIGKMGRSVWSTHHNYGQ